MSLQAGNNRNKGRIVAIDYGTKRTGIAVTDPWQLIATPLTTVASDGTIAFLIKYVQEERIATFVVGLPKHLDNRTTPMTAIVKGFIQKLKKAFPHQNIWSYDEKFTSKIALHGLITGGFKKKSRLNKGNIDKMSATILLQSFLNKQKIGENQSNIV